MLGKVIIKIFTGLVLIGVQAGFISGLPEPFNRIYLILVALVFILILSGIEDALWWGVGLGFMLDIYHFLPFGALTIIIFIVVNSINLLFSTYFTNRSLYSILVMCGLSVLFFDILVLIFTALSSMYQEGFRDFGFKSWAWDEIKTLGVNMLAAFIFFHVTNYIGYGLKPVFLIRKKQA
jgi:rod shape-determining protein MreD